MSMHSVLVFHDLKVRFLGFVVVISDQFSFFWTLVWRFHMWKSMEYCYIFFLLLQLKAIPFCWKFFSFQLLLLKSIIHHAMHIWFWTIWGLRMKKFIGFRIIVRVSGFRFSCHQETKLGDLKLQDQSPRGVFFWRKVSQKDWALYRGCCQHRTLWPLSTTVSIWHSLQVMLPGYYFESAFSTYETMAQSAVRGQNGMASKVQKELWKSLGMLSP